MQRKLTEVFGAEGRWIAQWLAEEPDGSYDLDEVIRRLQANEPLQYIFGHTDWRGLRLHVTPDTLIPRPETSDLIDAVLEHFPQTQQPISVLDIGTGSGCIAIALKGKRPHWQVAACDISDGALQVARRNAADNGTEVQFFRMDVLHDALPGSYDLLVSNPPYIAEEERQQMEANVLNYEPHSALFVPNDDPLLFYRRIARLQPHGTVAFEINERFGAEMQAMLKEEGYATIQLIQDICGKDRIVIASR